MAFKDAPVASWTVNGTTLYFPVRNIGERGGHRLAKRAVPYRKGVKVDGLGGKERVWSFEAIFENSIEETGIPTDPPLYPNVCNAMCDSADRNETGDLVLPTRGKVRARLEDYDRREDADEEDGARVTFTFVHDNEAGLDATSFQNPTSLARARQSADEATFSMESLGGFSQMLDDLENAAAELEDAIAAPGEFIQDVDQKAQKVVRIVQGVEDQFVRTATLGRDLLLDPDAWAAQRQLSILQDRTRAAVNEKNPLRMQYVTKRYRTNRSLFDIALEEGVNPVALVALNPNLNSLSVPAGTPVRVVERAA